jgi:hypothetical protein
MESLSPQKQISLNITIPKAMAQKGSKKTECKVVTAPKQSTQTAEQRLTADKMVSNAISNRRLVRTST